jgi:hypothetical protein
VPSSRVQAQMAQDAWKKFREENCQFIAGANGGMDIWVQANAVDCELEETYKRQELLEQILKDKRQTLRPWQDYEFQYQGRTSLNGGRYVEVNAFCNRGAVDDKFLRSKWLKVFDGGTCYFSGKFDPATNHAFDLDVNGLA